MRYDPAVGGWVRLVAGGLCGLVGGCAQLFDIQERAAVVDAGGLDAADAADGGGPCALAEARPTACAGATVDVCSDERHCGACGVVCGPDERAECLAGVCVDHAWPGWPISSSVESPSCDFAAGTTEVLIHAGTDLRWTTAQKAVADHAAGVKWCADQAAKRLGGFGDWRLPTRVELMTIVDLRATSPTVNRCSPVGVGPIENYCSRSPADDDPSMFYGLNGQGGISAGVLGRSPCVARCVHATRGAPRARFSKTGDRTYDVVTNLTWAAGSDAAGPAVTYDAAVDACAKMPGGAWRLPTLKELMSIVDERAPEPHVDLTFFAGTKAESYWSKDGSGVKDAFWTLEFQWGGMFPLGRTDKARVRCVLAGKP